MSTIDALIKEIKMLKPMPQAANRLLTLIEDPGSSISEIADIVLYEPSITANLLKVCNSAYFNLPRKVESITDAISLLGLEQLLDMVLLKGGADNLTSEQKGYGLHEGELWRHAVSSALIAKELAIKKSLANKNMIFTAALLKDIGKVVLDRYIGDAYEKIANQVQKKGLSFREAEKKIIGVDHAEIGGLIARHWNFSPNMIRIIQNHHLQNDRAKEDVATCIVYLADTICMMMGIGGGRDGLAYRFHDDVLRKLQITDVDMQIIIAAFAQNMQKVEQLINIV